MLFLFLGELLCEFRFGFGLGFFVFTFGVSSFLVHGVLLRGIGRCCFLLRGVMLIVSGPIVKYEFPVA